MQQPPVTQFPPKKPRPDQPPVLTLQEANDLKEQISQLHPDQQLQILEILQNNGEQLYPDEHGEVEIEIAKCCLGSVKQVKSKVLSFTFYVVGSLSIIWKFEIFFFDIRIRFDLSVFGWDLFVVENYFADILQ